MQAGPQRLAEQVVVAEPPPLVVQRDDEEVGPFQRLQHPLTVGPSGQGVAELAGQLVRHAGVEEEFRYARGLPVQDLLDQIVQDVAVATGERVDEPGDGVRRHRSGRRDGTDRAANWSPTAHPSVRAPSAAT